MEDPRDTVGVPTSWSYNVKMCKGYLHLLGKWCEYEKCVANIEKITIKFLRIYLFFFHINKL